MINPSRLRPFLWGVVGLLAAWTAQRQVDPQHLTTAAVLFVGAAAVCIWAFRASGLQAGEEPSPLQSSTPDSVESLHWLGMPVVILAIAMTLLMAWQMDVDAPTSRDWSLHVGSVVLFLTASYLFQGARSLARLRRPALVFDGTTWLLVLALLVAGFFRFYKLDELPFGVWYDEGMHALLAQRILNEPTWRPIFEYNAPAHYQYLTAFVFRWFGTSIHSMRAVNASFGVLTVLFAYLTGRELLDRRSGLLLAFLVAVADWSVLDSRFAMHASNTVPLFSLASAFFLLRALRLRTMPAFAWSGFWVGLGLTFYSSYRLFIPVLAAYAVYRLACERVRSRARPLDRRLIVGLLCATTAAILVATPIVLFAWQKPDVFWQRVREVYIFRDKTPDQYWPVLSENIRRHLLMFNVAGDNNGRHNLPGTPMLDAITGALMVVGVAWSLWRIRQPRYLLLILWLVLPLSAGIFSLDFEAPHSIRANGSQPAAYLLAIVPLYELWRAWDRAAGRLSRWLALPLSATMVLVGYVNYENYFNRYATNLDAWNAWSTAETLAAKRLNELPPNTEPYLINYFDNHPTIRFLTNEKSYNSIQTTDHLPLEWPRGKNVELMFNRDSRSIYDEARRLYPNASFEEVAPPFGGPVALFRAFLTADDVQSIEGLETYYYDNDSWRGEPVLSGRALQIDDDWTTRPPLALPFSAAWNGVLHVREDGPYQIVLRAPGRAELHIDDTKVIEGTGILAVNVPLATGNHSIRLRAVGGAGPIALSWRTPDGQAGPIPRTALLSPVVSSGGLLGRFFPNDSWQEPAQFARIEPALNLYFHVIPLPRPYTVEWTGRIAIPQSGEYDFALESIDESTLLIDGRQVVRAPVGNREETARSHLDAGMHDILIRYADRTAYSHINLYWAPPGRIERQPVPSDVLFPPMASYESVTIQSSPQGR